MVDPTKKALDDFDRAMVRYIDPKAKLEVAVRARSLLLKQEQERDIMAIVTSSETSDDDRSAAGAATADDDTKLDLVVQDIALLRERKELWMSFIHKNTEGEEGNDDSGEEEEEEEGGNYDSDHAVCPLGRRRTSPRTKNRRGDDRYTPPTNQPPTSSSSKSRDDVDADAADDEKPSSKKPRKASTPEKPNRKASLRPKRAAAGTSTTMVEEQIDRDSRYGKKHFEYCPNKKSMKRVLEAQSFGYIERIVGYRPPNEKKKTGGQLLIQWQDQKGEDGKMITFKNSWEPLQTIQEDNPEWVKEYFDARKKKDEEKKKLTKKKDEAAAAAATKKRGRRSSTANKSVPQVASNKNESRRYSKRLRPTAH